MHVAYRRGLWASSPAPTREVVGRRRRRADHAKPHEALRKKTDEYAAEHVHAAGVDPERHALAAVIAPQHDTILLCQPAPIVGCPRWCERVQLR